MDKRFNSAIAGSVRGTCKKMEFDIQALTHFQLEKCVCERVTGINVKRIEQLELVSRISLTVKLTPSRHTDPLLIK